MVFHSQQPAAPGSEVGDLHLDAGPDMMWTSGQDLNSTLELDQNFNFPQKTKGIGFQPEPALNSDPLNDFIPYQHLSISQTGPPFQTTKSHVSDFRQFNTDYPVPGKKENHKETCEPQIDKLPPWTKWDAHFSEQHNVAFPLISNSSQYGFNSTVPPTYHNYMPQPVTTPGMTDLQQGQISRELGTVFGSQTQFFTKPRQQSIPRRPSRKRPRHRPLPQNPSMAPINDSPWETPALSSTTSTLDSRVDEIVSDDAASVIENWLYRFPKIHIPTDEHFKALATLTDLQPETVRAWFGQRLRREPREPSVAPVNSFKARPLLKMNSSLKLQNSSRPPPLQPLVSIHIPPIPQAVLTEAARWVRERGIKCAMTQDLQLLTRYEPRPYQCTAKCGRNFSERSAWRRHEEINHPQEGWVCDLGSITMQDGVQVCTFCGIRNPGMHHLQQAHAEAILCHNKPMSDPGKISYRKDKLKQHFTNTHPGVDCTPHSDACHFEVASRFSRRCGFCVSYQFSDWDDRITHIGNHFSNDKYDMNGWQAFEEDAEDEDEIQDDDADDDQGFDEDQNDHTNHFGDDFDWHDHDCDDGAFSDSEDDSDDSPPGSAPKQRTQAGHDEAVIAWNLEGSDATSELRHPNRPIQTLPFDSSVSGSSLRSTQASTQNDDCGAFASVSLCDNPSMWSRTTRYTRTKVLGIGPYSVVDEVHDLESGRTFARKTVHYTTQRTYRALKAEVEIMKKLKHPHIVRFVGAYTTDHSLSILMTPSADFDLAHLIGSHSRAVNTETMLQWFSCLASSVDYLHSNCVKHQDIKPSNILIRGDAIFLADFGVAKTFNELDSTSSTSGNMTRKYCSPETVRDGYRGRKSDIFSLGCVFLEMLSFLLHDDKTDFRDYQWKNFVGDGVFYENLPGVKNWLNILLTKVSHQPSSWNMSRIIDACKGMMEQDSRNRPSARELANRFTPGECCEEPPEIRGISRGLSHIVNLAAQLNTASSTAKPLPIESAIQSSSSVQDQTLPFHIFGAGLQYRLLDESKSEMRLLRIEPALGGLDADCPIWNPREYFLMIVKTRMKQVLKEWECLVEAVERRIPKSHLIRCTLEHSSYAGTCRNYTALSYCWRDRKDTLSIIVNGCIVPVTKNLKAAHRELCGRGQAVVWVDTLCINQNDKDERSHPRMTEIYSKAHNIVTWLSTHDRRRLEEDLAILELLLSIYTPPAPLLYELHGSSLERIQGSINAGDVANVIGAEQYGENSTASHNCSQNRTGQKSTELDDEPPLHLSKRPEQFLGNSLQSWTALYTVFAYQHRRPEFGYIFGHFVCVTVSSFFGLGPSALTAAAMCLVISSCRCSRGITVLSLLCNPIDTLLCKGSTENSISSPGGNYSRVDSLAEAANFALSSSTSKTGLVRDAKVSDQSAKVLLLKDLKTLSATSWVCKDFPLLLTGEGESQMWDDEIRRKILQSCYTEALMPSDSHSEVERSLSTFMPHWISRVLLVTCVLVCVFSVGKLLIMSIAPAAILPFMDEGHRVSLTVATAIYQGAEGVRGLCSSVLVLLMIPETGLFCFSNINSYGLLESIWSIINMMTTEALFLSGCLVPPVPEFKNMANSALQTHPVETLHKSVNPSLSPAHALRFFSLVPLFLLVAILCITKIKLRRTTTQGDSISRTHNIFLTGILGVNLLANLSMAFSIAGPLGLTLAILLMGCVTYAISQGVAEMCMVQPQSGFLWLTAEHELELWEKGSHGYSELLLALLQPFRKWITNGFFGHIPRRSFFSSSKGQSHNSWSKLGNEGSLKRHTGNLLLLISITFLASTTMNFAGNSFATRSDSMTWQPSQSNHSTEERNNRNCCGFWKDPKSQTPLDSEPRSQICPAQQHMAFRDFSLPTICHSHDSGELGIQAGALDLCPFHESQIEIGNHKLEEGEAEKWVSLTVDQGVYAAVEVVLKVTLVWGNEASPTHAERDLITPKTIVAIQRFEDTPTPTALLHPTATTLGGTTVVLSGPIVTPGDTDSVKKSGFSITSSLTASPGSLEPQEQRKDQIIQNSGNCTSSLSSDSIVNLVGLILGFIVGILVLATISYKLLCLDWPTDYNPPYESSESQRSPKLSSSLHFTRYSSPPRPSMGAHGDSASY